jgi:hypothetical protein
MTLVEWAKSRRLKHRMPCPDSCEGCIMRKKYERGNYYCGVPEKDSSTTTIEDIREYAKKVLNKVKVIEKWQKKGKN